MTAKTADDWLKNNSPIMQEYEDKTAEKIAEIDRCIDKLSDFYDTTKRICGERGFITYRNAIILLREYRAIVEARKESK